MSCLSPLLSVLALPYWTVKNDRGAEEMGRWGSVCDTIKQCLTILIWSNSLNLQFDDFSSSTWIARQTSRSTGYPRDVQYLCICKTIDQSGDHLSRRIFQGGFCLAGWISPSPMPALSELTQNIVGDWSCFIETNE